MLLASPKELAVLTFASPTSPLPTAWVLGSFSEVSNGKRIDLDHFHHALLLLLLSRACSARATTPSFLSGETRLGHVCLARRLNGRWLRGLAKLLGANVSGLVFQWDF